MNTAELFNKYPMMAQMLRTTVYRNGYAVGIEVVILPEWQMKAIEKATTLDAMADHGLVVRRKWTLTENGLRLACRLTS